MRYMGPLGAPGQWQELRLPLAWTPFVDRPILGLAFAQSAGKAWWDRTALVAASGYGPRRAGATEVVIEDETPAAKEAAGWTWVAEPHCSGGLAREVAGQGARVSPAASQVAGGDTRAPWQEHRALGLAKPWVQHLPFEPAKMLAFLEGQVPKLGDSEEAVRFLEAMVALEAGPEAQAARFRWFLDARPQHPRAASVLAAWAQLLKDSAPDKVGTPETEIEAYLAASQVPPTERYRFRRLSLHPQRCFLRDWQVLAPFRNYQPAGGRNPNLGHELPYPPEGRPVNVQAQFPTHEGGQLVWRECHSDRNYVDFGRLIEPPTPAVGYAACWVLAEKARPAVLEVSADSACKVWVNSRLVHEHINLGDALPGAHRVRVFFSAGWNELLVKVTQLDREWGFYAE
jgi:hypothetical protein